MKKFLSLILALSMLFLSASCAEKEGGGQIIGSGEEETKAEFTSKYADMAESNTLPVLSSENFKVSVSMFSYYFNCIYHNHVDSGETNIDPKTSLKEQTYSGTYSWFDYIIYETSDNVKIKLYLAEEAIDAGMTLSDEDYKKIDEEITKIDNNAKALGISTALNIKNYYSSSVDETSIRKCLELTALAEKYNKEVLDPKYIFTDEDYEEYFKKSPNDYLAMNYIQYLIPADKGNAEAEKQFAACKTAEEFTALIESRLATDYPDMKAEDYDKNIATLFTYNQYYSKDSTFAEWAYDAERKPYDVYVKTNDNGITYLAMMLPASNDTHSEVLYRDITPVHNVYAIAFLEDDYGDAEKAKAQAEAVAENARGGSDMASLCTMYGGGSMSNITRGDAPTAVEEWIFDENRVADEVGTVTVEGVGTYVIKMRADGDLAWKYFCAVDMTNEIYNNDLTAFQAKHPIGVDNDAVAYVTEINEAAEE